jgi:pentatricopeptide repeat protein
LVDFSARKHPFNVNSTKINPPPSFIDDQRLFSATSSSPKEENTNDQNIRNYLRSGKFGKIKDLMVHIFHQEPEEILKCGQFYDILSDISSSTHYKAGLEAETFLTIMMEFHHANRLDREPDTSLFALAIRAWMHSGHTSSGKRAEKILKEMEGLVATRELQNLQVDVVIYTSVLRAYGLQGKVKQARAIWDRMLAAYQNGNQRARPNLISVSTLLDAHARSGSTFAGKNAEKCLEEMIGLYQSGILEDMPNEYCMGAVIDAYAKSGDPRGAEAILEKMCKDYMERSSGGGGGNHSPPPQPNLFCFKTVLQAHAAGNHASDGATHAEQILKLMIELNEGAFCLFSQMRNVTRPLSMPTCKLEMLRK